MSIKCQQFYEKSTFALLRINKRCLKMRKFRGNNSLYGNLPKKSGRELKDGSVPCPVFNRIGEGSIGVKIWIK